MTTRDEWIEQQESSSDNRVVAIPASELRQLLREAMAFADAHPKPLSTDKVDYIVKLWVGGYLDGGHIVIELQHPYPSSFEWPDILRRIQKALWETDALREGQEDGLEPNVEIERAIHLMICGDPTTAIEILRDVQRMPKPTPPPREQGDDNGGTT